MVGWRSMVRFRRSRAAALGIGAIAVLGLAGCSLPGLTTTGSSHHEVGAGATVVTTVPAKTPALSLSPASNARRVPLDAPVQVSTDAGRLTSVVVHENGAAGPTGETSADGSSWQLGEGLDPGATYTITATAQNGDKTASASTTFSTLVAEYRLLTTYTPDDGEVVGVGEPIDLRFNNPIPDSQKAEVVQHLHVTSTPGVEGAWHWFTDYDL